MIRARALLTLALAACTAASDGGNPPVEYDFPDPADLPRERELPDPLILWSTGEPVTTAGDWRTQRRPEIRSLFEHYVYGRAPGPPAELPVTLLEKDRTALDGLAWRRQLEVRLGGADAPTMELLVYLPPEAADAPVPVFLGLNFYGNHSVIDDPAVRLSDRWMPERAEGVVDNRATEGSRGTSAERWSIRDTLARGYGVATAYHGDVDPDHEAWDNGIHPLYYAPDQNHPGPAEWGTIAAWAWGLSRALDALETLDGIDTARVAAVGHSRNGKVALLAAAFDARFALAIANQSGCTGAALSRRHTGETVKLINFYFPYWFPANYHAFDDREDHLPVDQHLLIALIAPRPVLVLTGLEDLWADPEGEFLGAVGASPVYELLGAPGLAATWPPELDTITGDTLAVHLKAGGHAIGPAEWAVFAEFAGRHL